MDEKLSLDIFFNIFSRLPLKSLVRSRSVSKSWCNIIDHPFLATMHLKKSSVVQEPPNMILVSLPTHRKKTMTFRLVQETSERTLKPAKYSIVEYLDQPNRCTLVGSCNGLLCFKLSNQKGFIILNPFRKQQYLRIPSTKPLQCSTLASYGFGYDSLNNTYKVVRIVHCKELYLSSFQVYCLRTGLWKERANFPSPVLEKAAVFSNGALHWLVISPVCDIHENLKCKSMIFSFDVGMEKFRFTLHPKFGSGDSTLIQLINLNDNLAMVDLSCPTNIDIWVMKDYEIKEWVKDYVIETHALSERFDNGHINVIGLWDHGEILLKADEGFYIYSKDRNRLRYIQSLGLESNSSLVYSLRGSLISISC